MLPLLSQDSYVLVYNNRFFIDWEDAIRLQLHVFGRPKTEKKMFCSCNFSDLMLM